MTTSSRRIVGFVQARLGSERVKHKNLRLVGEVPLVARGLLALRGARSVETVFLNTEAAELAQIASELGVAWYRRAPHLASSEARTDDWVADFLSNVACEIVVVVNPCVAFLTSATVERAVSMVDAGTVDTAISGETIRTHVIYDGRPLNFDGEGRLPRTQDLPKIYALNFGVAVWRSETFLASYKRNGAGVMAGRVAVVELDGLERLDVDTEMDFQIVNALASAAMPAAPRYHGAICP